MFRHKYPFTTLVAELFEIKPVLMFLLLCLITFLLLFIKKNFVEYEITAFQILDERGQLGMFKIISGLQYFSIPVIYLLKFTFIAFLIWVGCFAFGYRITYVNCWHLVMVAELVFVIPEIIKILWFLLVNTDPDFADVQAFYPVSLMNLFDRAAVPGKWHYPLKALNVFEVVYWFFLFAGIYVKSGKKYLNSMIIGISGYVLPFMFWLWYYTMVYK